MELTTNGENDNPITNRLKKIVLITSGMPALNPRLVKEADALWDAGYEVTVLYTYWNDWGAALNKQLLAEKKWTAIQAGGDPDEKPFVYLLSRLVHKVAKLLAEKTGRYSYFANTAIARSSFFLTREAKKHPADLYIAHNLGALSAAVKAAKHFEKPCGFDAEDFHRQETDDDTNSYHYRMATFIEDKYLPLVNYLTASSPLIAERYARLYKRTIPSILNVFPKTEQLKVVNNIDKPIQLFWFSQNLGPKRGLEIIIEALGLTKTSFNLHLLGNVSPQYKEQLLQLAQSKEVDTACIYFYPPLKADEIFGFAARFDIGLASETGFCLNNNIALSNKLFTYIQSGLAVVASNTPAQSALISQYPQIGKTYKNAAELAAVLPAYAKDRSLLNRTKKEAWETGQAVLNWDIECHKFLDIVENVLTASQHENHPKK